MSDERERAEQIVDYVHSRVDHDGELDALSREECIKDALKMMAEVWEEAADYHEKLLALCGRDEWRERIRHEEEVKYLRQRATSLREGRDE